MMKGHHVRYLQQFVHILPGDLVLLPTDGRCYQVHLGVVVPPRCQGTCPRWDTSLLLLFRYPWSELVRERPPSGTASRVRKRTLRGAGRRSGCVRRLGRTRITMVAALAPKIRYSGSKDSAQWRGHVVVDEDRFKSYVAGRVKARVEDDEAQGQFAAELHGMATTGMATEFVETLLQAVPEEKVVGCRRGPGRVCSCRRRDA